MPRTSSLNVWTMEDFGVLWVWGFCGDSRRFSVGMHEKWDVYVY